METVLGKNRYNVGYDINCFKNSSFTIPDITLVGECLCIKECRSGLFFFSSFLGSSVCMISMCDLCQGFVAV